MQNLNDLFTLESLLSLQGSAAAAILVPNVLSSVIGEKFKPYKKVLAFILAMLLAYLVAALAAETGWLKWILAFFNGCLVYASAVGLNESVNATTPTKKGTRKFFESWF
ncbi:MAG: hypothetical protein WCF08_04180 [Anaerolineaceae bacterium]